MSAKLPSLDGALRRATPWMAGAIALIIVAAVPMVMRGRSMVGWLRVPEGLESDQELETWVRRGVDYARTLPPKTE